MTKLRLLVRELLPERAQLAMSRRDIQRAYGKAIAAARASKDTLKRAELEDAERFEMELQQELEDSYLTSRMLAQARKLKVPIPYIRNSDGSESDHWYEGRQTGQWCLSTQGVRFLRQEIRQELKERHELRSQNIAWLTALTGIVGAITGLVAVVGSSG